MGNLVVRSFSRHGGQGEGARNSGQGHQSQLDQAGPLGGAHQGNVGQSGAYPGQSVGYPNQPTAYPSQPPGYPYQPVAYPVQPGGHPGSGALPYPARPAQGVPGVFYPTYPHDTGTSGQSQLPACQPPYPAPCPATTSSAAPLYPPLTAAPTSFLGYPSAPTYNAPNNPSIGAGGFVSHPI